MDVPHTNIVYQFEQQVEIMSRESERTVATNEVYERRGVVLHSVGIENARWKREITEYELAPVQLAKFRQQDKVARSQMQELHLKAVDLQRTSFGLTLPIEVDSDLRNRGVALSGPVRVPLRQDLICLPTLVPVVPEKQAEAGSEWPGEIEVMAGAGRFLLGYTARLLERTAGDPKIEVVFSPQSPTQTINEIVLTLSPQGRLLMSIARADGSPLFLEGDVRTSLRAKLNRDGVPVDVEVMNCHQKFKLTRVPASFNEEYFFPAGWKSPPEIRSHSP